MVGGGSPLSVTTSSEGSFVLPISNARALDLNSYVTIDKRSTVVEILVHTGKDRSFSVKYNLESNDPLPPLVVGQENPLGTTKIFSQDDLPKAMLEFPINQELSGFGKLILEDSTN